MSRKIQAPGIEINEIDLSEYSDTEDTSIVNTTVMLNGFTDKGIDYETKYVNSMATFRKMFGNPTNDAETYLYNATNEVISRGGVAYVSKLPYMNDTLDKYAYTSYTVLTSLNILSSPYDIITNNFGELKTVNLYDFEVLPNISVLEYFDNANIRLSVITDLFNDLVETYNFRYETRQAFYSLFYDKDGIYAKNKSVHMLQKLNEGVEQLCAYVTQEEREIVDLYREDFEIMREQLLEKGDLYEQIKHFGKIKSLQYHIDYLQALKTQVENSEVAEQEALKQLIIQIINGYMEDPLMNLKYTSLKQLDESLTSYMEIVQNEQGKDERGKYGTGFISMDDYDKLKILQTKVQENQIHFIDIKRNKYDSEYNVMDKENPMQYLGILPVITTPANALYYQKLIDNEDSTFREYNALSSIRNIYSNNLAEGKNINCMLSEMNNDNENIMGFTQNIGSERRADCIQVTLSKTAASYFPTFTAFNGQLERENIKKIGVVVFEMYVDKSSDYKIGFTPVESYVGSLNRYERDMVTKSNQFIDDIINQRSSRINCFSNIPFSKTQNVAMNFFDKASTFIISNQEATSLGFYEKDCGKQISYLKSINKALDRIFDHNNDINKIEFDLLVDAGVSNIAQFVKSVYKDGYGYFDIQDDKAWNFTMNDVYEWKTVIDKYDNFCKNVRKDCMFIADGMRPLCVIGNEKVVRNTKPSNTIENTVLKEIKKMSGLINTSYGAGYCDWFYTIDAYSDMYFWCPPSIKACGIYIYTDAYSNFWDAPAGLNRGQLPDDVIDVAFSPTLDEAGVIYNNNWNYSVSYPLDGIIQEGQRTFQKNKTAMDRVNVRRLMLGLERSVRYVAKFFTYEGITDYMMQKFVDSITPILEYAKDNSGISDYFIKCDRDNNTTFTIENNELHCTIAVKPIKSLEFLVLNFICTNQSADVQEVAENNL